MTDSIMKDFTDPWKVALFAAVMMIVGALGLAIVSNGAPLQTDPSEVAIFVTSSICLTWCFYTLRRNYLVWHELVGPDGDLRPIALRRMRQQGFLAVITAAIFIQAIITMFLPIGDTASNVRGYCLIVVCLLLLHQSAFYYFEQRSVDTSKTEEEMAIRRRRKRHAEERKRDARS